MSAVAPAPLLGARRPVAPARAGSQPGAVERPVVRLVSFLALAAYGLSRWATLIRPAPGWRFVGLLALAAALAGGAGWLARRSRIAGGLAVVVVLALALAVSGLAWHSLVHVRITVTADEIGRGLSALPGVLVPYLGTAPAVRMDIVLGAAVLVLDAAAVIAFAGRPGLPFGDGRRAAAALPLVALAVVPSTLVRPSVPYLQGVLLFGLVAAFVWGERVRGSAGGSALLVLVLGGIAAALLAPRLDEHHAWVDYRAWAGAAPRARIARFDWNQTYGPLRWPRTGHVVMSVTAARPDYWKAEDLDEFDGVAWRYGVSAPTGPLPEPSAAAAIRYTQTIGVSIEGMQTPNIIAAGVATPPLAGLPGGYAQSLDPGSWLADRPLGPGMSYRVATYSPRPSEAELLAAGTRYPARALGADLVLAIPVPGGRTGATVPVRFGTFGSGRSPSLPGRNAADVHPGALDASAQSYVPATPPPLTGAAATAALERSPYARAYALARRLAAGAATPEAYVEAVMRALSTSRGFVYDENPPTGRYPLETFLFSTRRGYCQQFSGAMAMLLRMGGIPARVAAGFTPGTRIGGRYVVSDLDAHAWVEAWFPGYGWVRRDPTPAADPALGGSVKRTVLSRVASPDLGALSHPVRRATGASNPVSVAPSHVGHRAGAGSVGWLPIVAGAIVLLAALLAAIRLTAGIRARSPDPVAELERALVQTGRPAAAGTTLAAIERWVRRSPEASAYVRALQGRRYGATGPAPTPEGRRALRRELARGLGVSGRLRAWWALPPRPRRPGATGAGREPRGRGGAVLD